MKLRLIPVLDEDPQILAGCAQPLGQWTLLVLFTPLLALLNNQWLLISLFLALTTLFPGHRRSVVSAVGVLFAITIPNWLDLPFIQRIAAQEGLAPLPRTFVSLIIAGIFLFLTVIAIVIFRFPTGRLIRRPVFAAILLLSMLVAAISISPFHGFIRIGAWIVALVLVRTFWFFCYSAADRNSRGRDGVALQIGLWRPVWMLGQVSGVPVSKGAAYLRRIEAQTPEDLAITQCKGFKLLLWALLLKATLLLFNYIVYRKLGVPEFSNALDRSVAGLPFPWYWDWLSLVAGFLAVLLNLSVVGHQIIACVRMAGFRALRNTYRPLESRTLAEFWNRYYFYFKELLVDMFFYPIFLRYFKKSPRLRLAAATMMAACVGNAVYHFFDTIASVGEIGLWRSICSFQTYLFYCFVLGTGICVSQLRSQRTKVRARSRLRDRLLSVLSVSGFYCLLNIFDDPGRTHSLREHFVFVGRLFGL